MNNDIKIDSTVQLLYWKDNKVNDFFEAMNKAQYKEAENE